MSLLDDLGLADDVAAVPETRPVAPEPGTISLRDAALNQGHPSFSTPGRPMQDAIRDLGVARATVVLREAIQQIWGGAPATMPMAALLMTAPVEDSAHVDTLNTLLNLVVPERIAGRILTLVQRRAAAFLTEHLSWQARLADEGVPYPEMERRALLGEFDLSGPLPSTFDLATMSFR